MHSVSNYPTSEEIEKLFNDNFFTKISTMSIRSFAYEKEDKIYNIKDQTMFKEIMNLIEKTSEKKEIIETCGHAMYIGKKTN